jgi:hypothetical protein
MKTVTGNTTAKLSRLDPVLTGLAIKLLSEILHLAFHGSFFSQCMWQIAARTLFRNFTSKCQPVVNG